MEKRKSGRPKGAGNRDIDHLRKEVEKLVTKNRDKLNEALEMMYNDSPKDFVNAYIRFMDYVLPKALQKIEHSVNDDTLNKISINIVTKEQNGDKHTGDESI